MPHMLILCACQPSTPHVGEGAKAVFLVTAGLLVGENIVLSIFIALLPLVRLNASCTVSVL